VFRQALREAKRVNKQLADGIILSFVLFPERLGHHPLSHSSSITQVIKHHNEPACNLPNGRFFSAVSVYEPWKQSGAYLYLMPK
jgi:hypothetical protein